MVLMFRSAFPILIEYWILLDDVFLVDIGKNGVGLVPSLVHDGSVGALSLAAT